jgi:hypothetical protein
VTTEEPSNFTPRAQQVLALARGEADRLNHNFLGTEHILLGLLKLGQGTAVNVLQKLGVNLENVRAEVEKQVGTGPDQKMIGNIPYTPRVRKVIALAQKEANQLNHTYVGTEHLLLGLLREGDGVAAKVLRSLDVDIQKTRIEIMRELAPNFVAGPVAGEADPDPKPEIPEDQKFESLKEWLSEQLKPVDLCKRYDVYCIQHGEPLVYRNVLFKDVKALLPTKKVDLMAWFVELEQPDGKSVYLPRHAIFKFSDPGANASGEKVPSGT